MDVFDSRDVTAYVLKGKKQNNPGAYHRIYDLTFKTWHETWEKTYQKDFHSDKRLNSDTFTRQDEILSLFYKGECIALCIFSHINLDEEQTQLDSYFNCWSKEAIRQLAVKGPNVVTCTQYTISKDFHRPYWKVLITGMIGKYFLASGRDSMSAITRVAKGIDKLSYAFGGIQLASGLDYEAGAEKAKVDLVAFFPENVYPRIKDNPYAAVFEEIWNRRNGISIRIAA